jgi:ferredoxin
MRLRYARQFEREWAWSPTSGSMLIMDPHRLIARVYIVDGCTFSKACEYTCPEVFQVLETGVVVRDGAHEHYVSRREAIEEAADGCPLEAIQVEYEDGTRLAPLSTLSKGP